MNALRFSVAAALVMACFPAAQASFTVEDDKPYVNPSRATQAGPVIVAPRAAAPAPVAAPAPMARPTVMVGRPAPQMMAQAQTAPQPQMTSASAESKVN